MNFDEFGLVGQKQSDGSIESGDCLNWTGHLLVFYPELIWEKFKFDIDDYIETFSVGFGAYVRHPDPLSTNHGFGAHYEHPWDGIISRDQLTGILGALIVNKKYLECLKISIHAMAWLWLFSYNTRANNWLRCPQYKVPDVTGPNIWSMYLRGALGWFSLPFNLFFDLHILLDTIVFNLKKENDPISFAMKLYISKKYYPSPASLLAFKLANKFKLKDEYTAYCTGWRSLEPLADAFCKKVDSCC